MVSCILEVMKVNSLEEMLDFGRTIASRLRGGEVIELVGDVGAGKTTFTKGLATGLGVQDTVQSPTFTISREYATSGTLHLVHYDFYRLDDAGIMADELAETLAESSNVTVVEWAETVASVLPKDRLTLAINLVADDETTRELTWNVDSKVAQRLLGVSA